MRTADLRKLPLNRVRRAAVERHEVDLSRTEVAVVYEPRHADDGAFTRLDRPRAPTEPEEARLVAVEDVGRLHDEHLVVDGAA